VSLAVGVELLAHGAHRGTGGPRAPDQPGHLVELGAVADRAQADPRVESVAGHEPVGRRGEPLDEVGVVRPVHVDARGGDTDLAPGGVDRADQLLGRGVVDGGALQHDRRVVAAELEADVLEVAGRLTHDRLAGGGAAGEEDRADQRVPGDGGAPRAHPGRRRPRPPGSARPRSAAPHRARRSELGGLDDDGVAGQQRRRDPEEAEVDGAVPGHDHAGRAHRTATGPDGAAAAIRSARARGCSAAQAGRPGARPARCGRRARRRPEPPRRPPRWCGRG
jgi:hypothetical protein